jgi:hypothetical protein
VLTLKIGAVTYCAFVTFSAALLKSGEIVRGPGQVVDRFLPGCAAPMGLILDIYEANGLNFPPIKKRNPTSLKHISHKTSLFSRAVRLQLCRQSTVPVAKSSALTIRYRDIGSVKDRPHLAVSG